jgi:hypothetical protein
MNEWSISNDLLEPFLTLKPVSSKRKIIPITLIILMILFDLSANSLGNNEFNDSFEEKLVSSQERDFMSYNLHRLSNANNSNLRPKIDSRGIVMCVGTSAMIQSLLVMMHQLRKSWKSKLRVAVAHCDELSEINQNIIRGLHADVNFINICIPGQRNILGMNRKQAIKKLRGFFCKVGAMINSPFKETMLIDLDVIWLQKPDLLFESLAYRRKGSLFFRDRIIHEGAVNHPFAKSIQKLIQTKLDSSTKSMSSKVSKHGGGGDSGLFFSHQNVSLEHYQESSVVLINIYRQTETMNKLRQLLPTFSLGWGEKEIFWIASSIANAEYSFEPYLCGSYGDCGFQMHFEPSLSKGRDSKPFFINAEYLIDGFKYVGEHLQEVITFPVIVKQFIKLYDQDPWKRFNKIGCSCPHMGCKNTPKYITYTVLRMQWVAVSQLKLSCIPVSLKVLHHINEALYEILSEQSIGLIAIPKEFPIKNDSTNLISNSTLNCVLVHY